MHVDHLHPKALGGQDVLDNLVTACVDCNVGKAGRLDVAIRGLVQPLPQPEDSPDKEVVAKFEMPPLDLEDQLREIYNNDQIFCSDGDGRRVLLTALGLTDEHVRGGMGWKHLEAQRQERWFKEILSRLPYRERWVVERRTGLWSGTFYSQTFADIGAELGESANHARELYNRGIVRLRRLLGVDR